MARKPRGPLPGGLVLAGLAIAALGIAVVVVFATGLFHDAPQTAVDDPAEVRGFQLAQSNCAACHAIGPEGESPHSDAPPFRTFKEMWPVENLEEALAEGIVTGHDNPMPEYEFTADQVGDFIAYLKTL
ncbi:c-type cytochrome [Tepidamorphus sp. 3E244]|uniref:c-type cytochrome n=1 Tax=Tepidamorphus sp. 3E244 TaxID=3385498 RepID=UPI0038FC35A0